MSKTKTYSATLIPGDGIGPEVTDAALEILAAAGISFSWDRQEAGADIIPRFGTPLPDSVVNSIVKNHIALKGPIGTPVGEGFPSVNVALRKRLGLYANVRPAKTIPGVKTPFAGIDIVVVRENSEDLYAGIEHVVVPGVVESLKIITEVASTRIAKFAFEYARNHNRKKVSAVHKANIMKLSDGLFLDCCRRVAREYSEIEYQEVIVDNCCMQLVTRPQQFDVMVMENLYGDIISDLVSGLVGGLGVTGSANIGTDAIVYEAVHGTAPDIAGKGLANPTAVVMSSVLMLRQLGESAAADRIESALFAVFEEGKHVTRDLGGQAGTAEFVKAVIGAM
ncbi:MAG: isocitrate dehydrogenase (NAD(+)) [Armatimonadetes bacterium]|nr:isocitrate dehydrogenase (NAD(+)) [Armatimonadota bacterium]